MFILNHRLRTLSDYLNSFLFRCVHSFGDPMMTYGARFDKRGNRLVCSSFSKPPVIYNVPTEQPSSNAVAVTNQVQLKAPGYSFANEEGSSSNCFAGDDDELVVASSSDHRLFIWSVSDSRRDRTINQSLLSLSGHHQLINTVRYNKVTSTLASGDQGQSNQIMDTV